MSDRGAYKKGPSDDDLSAVEGRIGFAMMAFNSAHVLSQTLKMSGEAASGDSESSLPVIATVTNADDALHTLRRDVDALHRLNGELSSSLAKSTKSMDVEKAQNAKRVQPAAIWKSQQRQAALQETHSTLASASATVVASLEGLDRELAELERGWPSLASSERRSLSAEQVVQRAAAQSIVARRALSVSSHALAGDDASVVPATGDALVQRLSELRITIQSGAPVLVSDLDVLLELARASGASSGSQRRSGRSSQQGPSFAQQRPSAQDSLLPANGATVELTYQPTPLSVRGFVRSGANGQFCWLHSLTIALAAVGDVRRLALQLPGPSLGKKPSPLLTLVASSLGAFPLTLGQVHRAAKLIVSKAPHRVTLSKPQSIGEALLWALSSDDTDLGKELRDLVFTERAQAVEELTTHKPGCPRLNPDPRPLVSHFDSPSAAVCVVGDYEFAMAAGEDSAGGQLPDSSFGTRVLAHLGAGAPVAGGADDGICVARLASRHLAFVTRANCEPDSEVPLGVCKSLITRLTEDRLTSAPSLFIISLQPGTPHRVRLAPFLFLTGLGAEVTIEAAAATAPVAHAYKLSSYVRYDGAHFTATRADGDDLLRVDDDRIVRSKGTLAGTLPDCAMAVYEATELAPGAAELPAVPVRPTTQAILASIDRLDPFVDDATLWASGPSHPEVIIINDSDDDVEVVASGNEHEAAAAAAPEKPATAAHKQRKVVSGASSASDATAGSAAAAAAAAAAAVAAAGREAAASAAAAAVAAMARDESSAAAAIAAARAAVAPFAMPGGQKRVRAPLSDETSEARSDGPTEDEGGSDVGDPEAGFKRARCSQKNKQGLQCKRKNAHHERHSYK